MTKTNNDNTGTDASYKIDFDQLFIDTKCPLLSLLGGSLTSLYNILMGRVELGVEMVAGKVRPPWLPPQVPCCPAAPGACRPLGTPRGDADPRPQERSQSSAPDPPIMGAP